MKLERLDTRQLNPTTQPPGSQSPSLPAQVSRVLSGNSGWGGDEGSWTTPSGDAQFELSSNSAEPRRWGHFVRPGSLSPAPQAPQPPAVPSDPQGREEFIIDQLESSDDLDELAGNVPDDPTSFQALLDILHEDFGVVVVDVGDDKRTDHFNTRDLLNLANQLNNLPDHIIEDYLAEGQTIRLSNGASVGDDPEFINLAGTANVGNSGQNPGGVAHHQGADGSGVALITLQGLREDGQGGPNAFGVDGSESTVLHELAHGLDDIGGNDSAFYDFSTSPEWRQILDDPQVLGFWQEITADGSTHETTARYEESFAEFFARYYVSDETRATLPASVQNYFANLDLQPTLA